MTLSALRRPLLWLGGLLLALGLLIWQTPALLERYLPPWLEQHYGLILHWERPLFTRQALILPAVQISDPQNKPLLGWARLTIAPDWWQSLRQQALILHEIRLSGPDVALVRTADDTLNVQAALAPFIGPDKPASADQTPPALYIGALIIEGGKLHYRDGRAKPKGERDPDLTLSELGASLTGLTLEAGAKLPFSLHARFNHAPLTGSGTLQLDPWKIKGEASLEKLALAPFAPLWHPWLALDLPKGSASVRLKVQADANSWQLTQGRLSLDNWQLARKHPQADLAPQPARFKRLLLDGIKLDSQQQKLHIASLSWQAPHLTTRLGEDYRPDLLALLTLPKETKAAPANKAVAPWQWQIDKLTLKGASLDLSEPSSGKQRQRYFSELDARFGPLSSRLDRPGKLHLSTRVDNLATFTLAGDLTPAPLALVGDLTEQGVPLGWAQAYVQNYLRARIESGTLSGRQRLVLRQDAKGNVSQAELKGGLKVEDLRVVDKRDNRRLLAWQTMTVTGLAASPQEVQIDEVLLESPFARVEVDKDGTTNLQTLILPGPTKPAATTKAKPSPAPRLAIRQVVTRQGALRLADRRLSQDFVVDIVSLNGHSRNISNTPGKSSELALEGKVDSYAPVSITGRANLLVAQPVLDLTARFKNLELTTFTPYASTYAGYAIDKGQVSMALQYQLRGNRLEGSNDIRITKLQLGDKVASPHATDLPLKLAVALLADSHGVINLDLKVKGDLDNPDFNVGSLFWDVLGNTIRKAVTSPFALLASLAGSEEQLDEVPFAPGSSELPPAGLARIQQLADALSQRPQLGINLRGEVDHQGDLQALQRAQLENQLGKSLDRTVSFSQIGSDQELQAALDSLYDSTFSGSVKELALSQQLVPGSNRAWQLGIDTLAARQPISDKSLRRLATQRAQFIKAQFVERHHIPADRIFVLDSKPGDEQSRARVRFSTESD